MPLQKKATTLILNAGSSSLKFALFGASAEAGLDPERILAGSFERIGQPDAALKLAAPRQSSSDSRPLGIADHAAAIPHLLELIGQRSDVQIVAVGHRVVHGGERFSAPQRLDPQVMKELTRLSALSPEHMPAALSVIEALREVYKDAPHIACFDTAFHHELPVQAAMLPIPRRYAGLGVRRYGFHGLSYAYLMQELHRVAGPAAAAGRIVLAHLGHGASMAAVHAGRCLDTTMALTPAAGLVMSTRSGDLDPGLLDHLARIEGMTPQRFQRMVHAESGLLGISETSGDVRELLAREAEDPRAREALAIFCYQARKWIGAMAAALEGIDTLIFSGGIGENAASIRARICAGLEFLGVTLDDAANRQGAQLISGAGSRVAVRVLHTDEELYMARIINNLMKG